MSKNTQLFDVTFSNVTLEQKNALFGFANLIGITDTVDDVDTTPDVDAGVIPAPVKALVPFTKSVPLTDYVGKCVRMTEKNGGRWGGIHKACKTMFADKKRTVKGVTLNAWNKDAQLWVFSSKANAEAFVKSQQDYAKANPQYPCIVEIC